MAIDLSRLSSALLAVIATGAAGAAVAEISTDGTVGPRGRLAGPDFAIGAELGTRAGGNLFHSFERFSLATGERATFSGPDAIRNVISRVTGGARSDIDGTIASTIPGADFYFINPAGVLFGPNARLAVPGSFHVSTADELRFAGGGRFSARDPSASSLAVAAPEAFGFLGHAPAGITVSESMLEVRPGNALSLVGGELDVTGGAAGLIGAGAGRITLAALGGPGVVPVGAGAIAGERAARIMLSGQAFVDVSGDGGGTVRIRGGEVRLAQGSLVLALNTGAAPATGAVTIDAERLLVVEGSGVALDPLAAGAAGRLEVDAREITIAGGSQLRAPTAGAGDAGQLVLRADRIVLEDGGLIVAGTQGTGRGGAATIVAGELHIAGNGAPRPTGVLVEANAGSTGDAGTISIEARTVDLRHGGVISATTFAAGDAGRIAIAADELHASRQGGDRFTGIASDAGRNATGNAGQIVIRGGSIVLDDGGVISVDTRGPGDGGAVTVDVARLAIDGGEAPIVPRISADASEGSSGTGGTIAIRSERVVLERGGQIRADAGGSGRGGAIDVDAGRLLISLGRERFTGLAVLARAGTGDGGAIHVQADRIEVRSGGVIAASTVSDGDAGSIAIDAGRVVVDGEGIRATGISSLAFGGTGNGGVIAIDAPRVTVRDGGVINTTTFGVGDGGQIDLRAGRLRVENARRAFTGVSSSVETGAAGDGGAVRVVAHDILLLDGGQIRSLTFGTGDAGDVTVAADRVRVQDDLAGGGLGRLIMPGSIPFGIARSAILISAEPTVDGAALVLPAGAGGHLSISAREIALAGGAVISSSSFSPTGAAGDVVIAADRLIVDGSAILTGAPFAGGGRITILVDDLVDLADSWISSAVGGDETTSAGDITIDPRFVVLDASLILANADAGRGGAVRITVGQLIRSPDSVISATAGPAGIDGTVVISSPEIDLTGGLVVLARAVVDTAPLRERCATRRDIGASSLTDVGRSGLPPGPDRPLAGAYRTAAKAGEAALRAVSTGPQRPAVASAAAALPCTPDPRAGSAGREP